MKWNSRFFAVLAMLGLSCVVISCSKKESNDVSFPKGASCVTACKDVVFSPYVNRDKGRKMFWVFDRCHPFFETYFPDQVYQLTPAEAKRKRSLGNNYSSNEKIAYMKWEQAIRCQANLITLVKSKKRDTGANCYVLYQSV